MNVWSKRHSNDCTSVCGGGMEAIVASLRVQCVVIVTAVIVIPVCMEVV